MSALGEAYEEGLRAQARLEFYFGDANERPGGGRRFDVYPDGDRWSLAVWIEAKVLKPGWYRIGRYASAAAAIDAAMERSKRDGEAS